MVSIKEGNERLLQLARILARVPPYRKTEAGIVGYDQGSVAHACGSPSCAWGWWVYGNKARFKRIVKDSVEYELKYYSNASIKAALDKWPRPGFGIYVCYQDNAIHEFHLNADQVREIFSAIGCGGASTNGGKAAAAYIRNFVARRQKRKAA